MFAWLASTWTATWPNLLANVLWVPVVAVHHRAMKRHIRALRDHNAALHRQHEELLIKHVIGPASDAEPASKGL